MIAITGETGSGKSYSALTIAELIDPEFNIDKVVFEPKDFLKLLDTAKRGDVIVFDEAGVGIPAREWQTIQNKLFGYVLQVIRYKNIGIIFTVPHLNFIDSQARRLIHYALTVVGRYENYNKCVVYQNKTHPIYSQEVWEKWLFFDLTKEKYYDLNPIYVGLPSKDLAKAYEEISRKRKEEIYKSALEHIQALEEGVKTEGYDGRTIRKMKNISLAFYNLYKLIKDELGWSDRQIALKIGVNNVTLRNWIAWIESNKQLWTINVNS